MTGLRSHRVPLARWLALALLALVLGPASGRVLAYLRLGNLGKRLATGATTIATLRGLAPLPGRLPAAGLRISG
jgi:hypothetical protein